MSQDHEQDAQIELFNRMNAVLDQRDVEGAYQLADFFAEQDNMGEAERFRNFARKWEREDNAHDEHNQN